MRCLAYSLAVVMLAVAPAAASSVSLSDAVAMARSAAALIESSGEVPERMDVPLPRGGAVRMRSDGAVSFFCGVLLRCGNKGQASETVDLPRGSTRRRHAPRVEPIKGQAEIVRLETSALVRQCESLPALVKRAGGLPSAVWVGDKRLSTAQFFGAVLNALSGMKEGWALPGQAGVPAWKGPPSWPIAQPFEAATPTGQATGKGAPKVIAIKPDGVSPVVGSVSVTITYSGKLDYFEVSLDGKQKWMGNCSPFNFVWKTESEKNGEHTLAVRAVDKDGSDVRLERTFTVKNPI